MSANRSKNSKPEMTLRRALWAKGLRGYRLHYKKAPGRPDISFVSKQLAIFVHGCYWHRCPKCSYPLPKTNRKFWKEKFERNIERDDRKRVELHRIGWKVITVRECDLKKPISSIIRRIEKGLR